MDGGWFSRRERSPYTQMFLTHIDADGQDSPPIYVDNSTASNRAVNIPEFVKAPRRIQSIDVRLRLLQAAGRSHGLAGKGDLMAR